MKRRIRIAKVTKPARDPYFEIQKKTWFFGWVAAGGEYDNPQFKTYAEAEKNVPKYNGSRTVIEVIKEF